MADEIQQVDICIVCAKAEEAKAVINEFSGRLKVRFKQIFSKVNGYEYKHTTINYKEREPLTILVSWMAFTGPTQTINSVRSLLEEFRPRFVAMTGICAGYEKKVALGDLVAVPYAFYSEEGKVETGKGEQDRLRPEWRTHPTADRIVQYINNFSSWKTPVTKMKQRKIGRKLQESELPKCLTVPIASSMAVQGNNPFPKLLEHNRNALFLDQEVAAFYETLNNFPDIYFLAVKGVCDYGDMNKNDDYHDYAARASAIYLLYFIQDYVTETTMPRRDETLSQMTELTARRTSLNQSVETTTGSIFSVGFISDDTTHHRDHAMLQEQDLNRSDTAEQTNELWPFNIPNEYYYLLPGRERELKQLLAILQNPQGVPVIAVDGLGGLGKTALAAELARRALREKLFKGVIGDSAKLEDFSGGEFVTIREAILDFNLLLDSIAQQLGHWEIPPLKEEEKYAALTRLLRQHPYIILVDNIETSENASFLVSKLRNFLGNSRAIVTSRKQIRYDFVQSLSLRGLELADSLTFLEMDVKQRRVQKSLDIPREKLVEIHEITGGAPLAMKLVIAQASFLNLGLVLRQMRNADSDGLYTFIFRRSWEHLSPVAQRILYYIGKTSIAAVDWEELTNVGIAENESLLIRGINQLADYSLLEVSSLVGEKYYNIHQLTRQFVNGELPKLWQE